MTIRSFLLDAYGWSCAQAPWFLVMAVAIPWLGTIGAMVGKGGRTDADGRLIASLIVGFGLVTVVVELLALFAGRILFGANLLEANLALVLSPPLCLAGCVIGIPWFFPLRELASVRTFKQVGGLIVASGAILWFLSTFRGWGILFVGGLLQLALIALLAYLVIRRLFRRAFGAGRVDDARG